MAKRTRKTDPEGTSDVAATKPVSDRPLADPRMLRGLTPEDVPLPDADAMWSVLALSSSDATGSVRSEALTTRLRALALAALDLAGSLDDLEAASSPDGDVVDWYQTVGTDLVERAASSLGVLHAARSVETRREFRRAFALAQRQAGLEAELAALRTFLIGRVGPFPARLRDARRASLQAEALAALKGRKEPASWQPCVVDPENFDDLLKSRFVPISVRMMMASTSLSRERLYALRRWRLRFWGDAVLVKGRWVTRLELRGPPRGMPGK